MSEYNKKNDRDTKVFIAIFFSFLFTEFIQRICVENSKIESTTPSNNIHAPKATKIFQPNKRKRKNIAIKN